MHLSFFLSWIPICLWFLTFVNHDDFIKWPLTLYSPSSANCFWKDVRCCLFRQRCDRARNVFLPSNVRHLLWRNTRKLCKWASLRGSVSFKFSMLIAFGLWWLGMPLLFIVFTCLHSPLEGKNGSRLGPMYPYPLVPSVHCRRTLEGYVVELISVDIMLC